jgi:hypothetical protein
LPCAKGCSWVAPKRLGSAESAVSVSMPRSRRKSSASSKVANARVGVSRQRWARCRSISAAIVWSSSLPLYLRIFTARAATRRTVIAESVDSAAINALAGRVSGIASVALNAIELVSDT